MRRKTDENLNEEKQFKMNTIRAHVSEEKEVPFRSRNKCYLLLTPRNVHYFSDNFPYEADGYFIFVC